MKTISKLFMPVLFLFGTALLAGCEDSKPPIDESEPENPTLFEYVLTVVDDTTGQPRAEESVTIKRTNKAGDVVHSSTDYTTDADGVITMNVRSGYYVAEAAFEPGGKKDVIHKFEIANHLLKSTMHLKDPNPDIYPHQSVITVRNAKNGQRLGTKGIPALLRRRRRCDSRRHLYHRRRRQMDGRTALRSLPHRLPVRRQPAGDDRHDGRLLDQARHAQHGRDRRTAGTLLG